MQVILDYFPNLTAHQQQQLTQLGELYRDWNDKINVISRKDIDNLYKHHILHSLAIARFMSFADGSNILDLGTGGGLPGIPLAILFPEVNFTLIDARRKKITVVNDIIEQLGLTNAKGLHIRAEEVKEKYDFVVSRAVTALPQLWAWSMPLIKLKEQKNMIPNGLITLKGGRIKEEQKGMSKRSFVDVNPLEDFYDDPWFEEKYVVYVQR